MSLCAYKRVAFVVDIYKWAEKQYFTKKIQFLI